MSTKYFLQLLCSALLFAGCGNGLDDSPTFEDIFNGQDRSALAPLSSSQGNLQGENWEGFFHSDTFFKLGKIYIWNLNPDIRGDRAFIINDAQQLKDYTDEYTGQEYHWPEIDFEQYSLVIGQYGRVGGSFLFLKDQRAVVNEEGTTLYLRFGKHNGAEPMDISTVYFGALYKKLPDGPVEIVRWVDESVVL